jgi:hypothetical protein
MVFDVADASGSIPSGTRVDAAGVVTFEGLFVVPDNLTTKPASTADAIAVVSPFIDVQDFDEPVWQQFKFVFPPKGIAG